MHLTKEHQRRAIHRALGSVAFTAAARVVLALAKDPEDENRRVLATVKNNLAPHAPALAFAITAAPATGAAALVWELEPVVGMDADALLSSMTTPGEREEQLDAEAFLRELLADGDVRATDGEKAARANGISSRTLDRARKRLGVRVYSIGFKRKTWWWTLRPKGATDPPNDFPKDATDENVASFEQDGEEKSERARASSKEANSAGVASFGGVLRANGPGADPRGGDADGVLEL